MSQAEKTLSAIRIFNKVQQNIKKINTAPLKPDLVRFNKDQAQTIGDDEEEGFPFARVGIEFPESNTQMTFTLDFLNTGVVLTVATQGYVWRDYEELGETNDAVARLLTDILIALSNGQLAMLVSMTEDDERMQAFELLYRASQHAKYDAICTASMFQSARKLRGREYRTDLYANRADIPDVKLDVERAWPLFILDDDIEYELMQKIGRRDIGNVHQALTREIFQESIDKYAEEVGEEAAKKVDEKFDAWLGAGTSKKNYWELTLQFARWRHIELLLWGFSLLMCNYWIQWNITSAPPTLLLLGVSLIPLFVFRKRYPYPQILYIIAPVGYILFALGSYVFVQEFINHWLSWVIAIFAAMSIAENIVIDIYYARRKILGSK